MKDTKIIASAFNQWMRDFIDDPEKFAKQEQDVANFLAEENGGERPTYGERCSRLLQVYYERLAVPGPPPQPPVVE